MTPDQDLNRMRWASRRGLLELDLLLAPFVDARYQQLTPELKIQFQQLVTGEDQDIMNWVMGREPVADQNLADIVAKIRAHNQAVGEARRAARHDW